MYMYMYIALYVHVLYFFCWQYVHEDMLGMRFRVSPDAFFQVNTAAAEVLYSTIKELTTSKIQKPVIYGQ